MHRVFPKLVLVFVIAQFFGVWAGAYLIGEIETGEMERPTILTENPDDPVNALALIGGIFGFTALLLVFLFFFKGVGFFRVFEVLVIFSGSFIVFSSIVPEAAFLLAVELVMLKLFFPQNLWIRNISALIAVAGVGALVGVSLGIIPVLIFLILLSVYDFIAVFKTKHMVKLAKGISGKNLAFTVALPTKEHQFELGTGDLVLPLVFAVSAMDSSKSLGFPLCTVPAFMILVASLVGLLLTINYVRKHVGKALPALPPQVALMIIAWLASKAIFP